MPTVNNNIGYGISGVYEGTILRSPAVIPAAAPLEQSTPNIVSLVLSSTGTSLDDNSNVLPAKTNNGFGVISVASQSDVVATTYMDTLTLVAGNNITLTTNSTTDSVTISSTDSTGISSVIGGTSISVATANNVATITNTFTETVYQGGNVTTSLTPNRNNGTIQKFTLTSNITLTPPTNMSAGQSLTLILTQDSTGNRLLNANTAYLFASGFQTLSTTSGGIDMLNIFSDGSTYYTTLTVDYS
jgi:hypothetical protein